MDYLRRYEELSKYDWFIEMQMLASGDSFGGFDDELDSLAEGYYAVTASDCHFAVLDSKYYYREIRKIEKDRFEEKMAFFKHLPWLYNAGLSLLKKLMTLFEIKNLKREQ